MTDLSLTVAAKSDQLNADDLIKGPRVIEITEVAASDEPEQPIVIRFKGDGGKPYKPCKSMRRALIHIWGKDGKAYAGRSLALYRDPKVKFGSLEVGGIRISHASHIDGKQIMALTATKGAKRAYEINVLPADKQGGGQRQPENPTPDQRADRIVAAFEGCVDYAAVEKVARQAKAAMDELGDMADQKPFQRADAARAAAYQKHMPRPEAEGEFVPGDAFEGEPA